jgi:hypothetical protein
MKQPSLCDDKALLVAFLYGECDQADRDRMQAHVTTCAGCAAELDSLRGARVALREWSPPVPALGFRVVREEVTRPRWAWPRVPVWAQAMAAVLVLAASAGIANLHVTVGASGVTVRTGWSQAAAPTSAAATRTDLAALEQKLRGEIASHVAAASVRAPAETRQVAVPSAAAGADAALVRSWIAESEQRQRGELDRQMAQRFVDFQRDVNAQQRADLLRLQQGFVQFQGRTSADLAQLRQLQSRVQNYVMRVAQVQEIK